MRPAMTRTMDRRHIPNYSVSEAARILRVSRRALRPRRGLLSFLDLVDAHIQIYAIRDRVEFENGIACRLFPFSRPPTGGDASSMPQEIVVDPTRCFGSPILDRARVRVSVVAGRLLGGDAAEELAEEFGCSMLAIEEARDFSENPPPG